MKRKVVKVSDAEARLSQVRIRIHRDYDAMPPWEFSESPLVYWSPDYSNAEGATNCPTVVDAEGIEEIEPGILCALVYAYEHGGVTVSTSQTTPRGSQCGCVWCNEEEFRDFYGKDADFNDVARRYVDDVNAFYNCDVYGVVAERWRDADRDWLEIGSIGNFYPSKWRFQEMISFFREPGRIVCANDSASEFIGLEYDEYKPTGDEQ